jgi:trans-aconitate methyltransferase
MNWNTYQEYWDEHWSIVGPRWFVTDMSEDEYNAYLYGIYRTYRITAGATIYDLGCGTGLFVPTVKRLWPSANYTGFDICAEAIEFARARYPEYTWVKLDAPELQGKADLIIVISVFTHISQADTEHYLDVIHDALNPGGKASVSIHTDCNQGINGNIYTVNYEPGYFEGILQAHGFKILSHTDRRQRHYEVEPC